jgi:hypothetical protein
VYTARSANTSSIGGSLPSIAEREAPRVRGVRAVLDLIEVVLPPESERTSRSRADL